MTVEKVSLSFELESGNDAVVTDPCGEVARILKALTGVIEKLPYSHDGRLCDVNGNTIGHWYWSIEREEDDDVEGGTL